MKRIFIIILYYSENYSIKQELSLLMLNNVMFEISRSESFKIYDDTIHILSEKKDIPKISDLHQDFPTKITFQYIEDSFTDIDMMNHRLNTYIQRAAVSTDAEYLLVISGNLPTFTNSVFSRDVFWESDINIGFSQNHNSEMILFKKQYTPFFFRLSDPSIKTGERSLTLFKQYKREISVIETPGFYKLDKNSIEIFNTIKETLKKEKNMHQSELYHLLID